ncbi:MAG TPA: hypothetical protein VLB83_00295 [Candidatus Paceibacterota bacterium]|nr:hypothetical protein [Candidatus Paceibacterota bacterium]
MIARIQEFTAVDPFDIRAPSEIVERISRALRERRPVAIGWLDQRYLGRRADDGPHMYLFISADCTAVHCDEILRGSRDCEILRWQHVSDLGRNSDASCAIHASLDAGYGVALLPERLGNDIPEKVICVGSFATYLNAMPLWTGRHKTPA